MLPASGIHARRWYPDRFQSIVDMVKRTKGVIFDPYPTHLDRHHARGRRGRRGRRGHRPGPDRLDRGDRDLACTRHWSYTSASWRSTPGFIYHLHIQDIGPYDVYA